MRTIFRLRSVALIATIAMMGATAFVASGATGAYFSDTHSGVVTGSTGSIEVTPSGGSGTEGMDLSLDLLLPGVPQTARVWYTNTGLSPQDIWIVFDSDDLATLNGAGTNVTVQITSSGGYSFTSADVGTTPVPGQFRVHNNLGATGAGYTDARFGIAASVSDPAAAGLTGLELHYDIVATQVGIAPGA